MSSVVDVLLQVVSVMGLAAFVVSVVLQVVTYGRARPMRPFAIAVGQAGSLLGMILFSALTKRPPDAVLWSLLLAGGCAAGIVGGQLVGVKASPQGIVMKHAVPGLLAWAAVLLFVQGSVTFAGTVPFAAYGAAIVILGVNLGLNGRVVARAHGMRTPPGAAARLAGMLLLVAVLVVAPVGRAVGAEHTHYAGGFQMDIETLADVPSELRPFVVDGGGVVRAMEITGRTKSRIWVVADPQGREIAILSYTVDAGERVASGYEYVAETEIEVYPTPEDARAVFEANYNATTMQYQPGFDWITQDHRAVFGADDSWVELHEYEYGWTSSGPPYAIVDTYWLLAGSMIIDIRGYDSSGSQNPEIMKQHALAFEKWLANCAQQIVDAARARDLGPYLMSKYVGGTGGETGTGDGTGETETDGGTGETGTGTGTGTGGTTRTGGTFPPLTPVERGTATGAAGGLMLLGALVQLLLARGAAPVGAPPSVDVQPPPTTCSRCGAPIVPGAGVCAACGLATPVEPPVPPESTLPEPASTPPTEVTSTCPQCGAILPQGLAVCPACGLATSGLVPASSPSTAAPAPANAGRGGTPRIALVVVAIVTLLLLACVLGWNALGLRDDRVDTPPETSSTPPPPPSEPVVELSSGPISEPTVGSAERTALMDAARLRLGIQNKFVVGGLFVQGDRAVGILNPEGTADYHLIAWTRSGEVWTAVWNGTPDAAGKAVLEQAALGLSPELIAKLGL